MAKSKEYQAAYYAKRKAAKSGGGSEKKPMTIKEMIAKGMSPEQIRKYREEKGLYRPTVTSVPGVKGAVASTWEDVSNSSPNTLWVEGNVHAVLKNERGTVRIKGEKKDKYAILNSVNTAVIHIPSVSMNENFTKRDSTKINKELKAIKDYGFDTPKIATNRTGEVIVYAKRKRFTKDF